MKTQNCLSPTKQNMSPSRFPLRGGDPVSELLGFIKAAGLKLPQHIEKAIHQDTGSIIKIIPTEQQAKENQNMKKLKVKLGDTEFQLKKIEEDFAQFKLSARMEKQKQIKRWEEAYNQLKNTLQSSNQDSSLKLLKLREISEKEMHEMKEKHKAELKQHEQKLIKSYEEKIAALKKLSEREVSELRNKHAQQLSVLMEKHSSQIKQMRQAHENELRKLSLKHKQSLDAKQKQYESACLALQSQKKTQEKLHQKTRLEASQAKEKLYTQLYYEKNMKKHLEETLQKKQVEIKSLKCKIHDLEIDITLEKEKSLKRENQIRQEHEKQKQGIEQLNKGHIATLLQSHEKQLRKYQKSIEFIKEWNENKETLMKERYDEMEAKFDERPSRQEDLDAIQKLKIKIIRKQEQVRILNKELKNCLLESQNKEETYNRIFTLSKMDKRTLSKDTKDKEEYKSKQSLCRKSQTTDIKFLLKVYNKHI